MLPPAVAVGLGAASCGLIGAVCAGNALDENGGDDQRDGALHTPGSAVGTPQTDASRGRVMGIPVRMPSGPQMMTAFTSALPGDVTSPEGQAKFWDALKRLSGRSGEVGSRAASRADSVSSVGSDGMTPLQRERLRQQQRREEAAVDEALRAKQQRPAGAAAPPPARGTPAVGLPAGPSSAGLRQRP